ncbi:helix-turn-helix domain-containing protein [Erythrobacter sp. JK5]|uniref:helix-turn-helix domain-containing protein n=1 Tax=Erythrobacter sp. JK5 TaxID=2829500 RepID=UPI001BA68EF6|nr:helix-turn-helix domain-containing protein [Erythrobacter sp. JK5]QUL37237.1 AraC family transcriptional regulator [Erythrobacter sp. JK5]
MPSHFSLAYFDPPPELNRHILTTFFFSTEQVEIEDRHPGGLGQVVLFPRGEGEADLPGGVQPVSPGAYMFCGFSAAMGFRMRGPWHSIGASLSPLGWAALTGQPANTHIDRLVPAREFLGHDIDVFGDSLIARYNTGTTSGEAACHELADWIGRRLGKIAPSHERLIETTICWLGSSLNPEMEDLFARLTYSRRQGERLIERYFGLPPAALARKFRAVRAAALLSQEDLGDEAEAEIAAAFYDQPHMIREIRRFCGYTPSRLGGPADPIFHTMIRLKNFDRLAQFRAIE